MAVAVFSPRSYLAPSPLAGEGWGEGKVGGQRKNKNTQAARY